MDRSFLSDQAVVAASREFVCVRLATYEDEVEAKLLAGLYTGRTGALENSVFAILDWTGTEKLTRAGRSPRFAFRDAAAMARGMRRIAEQQAGDAQVSSEQLGVPMIKDVRLAMNVAACDARQLVIAKANTDAQAKELDRQLEGLAWSQGVIGEFAYARSRDASELDSIEGIGDEPGLYVVRPNEFGTAGESVASIELGAKQEDALKTLRECAEANPLGSKDAREIIRKGTRAGVDWKTAVPVTDPHGPRTQERGDERRGRRGGRRRPSAGTESSPTK